MLRPRGRCWLLLKGSIRCQKCKCRRGGKVLGTGRYELWVYAYDRQSIAHIVKGLTQGPPWNWDHRDKYQFEYIFSIQLIQLSIEICLSPIRPVRNSIAIMPDEDIAIDINTISDFLAATDIPDIRQAEPVDCIVLCVSALIRSAETVFEAITARPDLTKVLVLCGGIGHSTQYLYDAVGKSKYAHLLARANGLPEAQVMNLILEDFLKSHSTTLSGVKVLVEDRSTNCGANASETRKVLEANCMKPASIIVVQDPTMMRRTMASFRKVFADAATIPAFAGCPTFVPCVNEDGGHVSHASIFPSHELWHMDRFVSLLLGEIPRLRNDEHGYGPKGKGFIVAVNIPSKVEKAWGTLTESSTGARSTSRTSA